VFDDLTDAESKALAQCRHAILGTERPMRLDCGVDLGPFRMAYQTYGTLNADKSNAVLICHPLTCDQFVAERHPVTGKEGWWESLVGPGKVLDPARYYIICVNVLGHCMGSTGPLARDPATGQPWSLRFPVVTVADMVRAQAALLDHLEIPDLFCVIGGSMGGMQVLEWAATYPGRVFSAVPIACASHHSAQNIAFHEVGRQAIMADPEWKGGDYRQHDTAPARGLAVARMTAHITYLSEQALQRKFGRALQNRDALGFGFDADFQVESYLRHQGSTFVDRFDANSYLYITRAIDYFDFATMGGSDLIHAFEKTRAHFRFFSYSADWLYSPDRVETVAAAARSAGRDAIHHRIDAPLGHDAFLVLKEPQSELISQFLA
jgi:homoserine O-acetyltransferase/O-succinyltransferase